MKHASFGSCVRVVSGIASLLSGLLWIEFVRAAPFPSDPFSGTTINPANWEVSPYGSGNGVLSQNNGLFYHNNGIGTVDDDQELWSTGTGSITSDWSVRVDVEIPDLAQLAANGQDVSLSMYLWNNLDPWSEGVDISTGLTQLQGYGKVRTVGSDISSAVAGNSRSVFLDVALQQVISLGLSWQASTQTFTAWYAPSGGGTDWIQLATWSVGPGSPTPWTLVPGEGFGLGIGGSSENLNLLTSANVRIRGFYASDTLISGRLPPITGTGENKTGAYQFVPLPAAAPGVPYSQPLQAAGGVAPYSWSIVAFNLPPELALAPNGTISGIPTTLGDWGFRVRVTGSDGAYSENQYSIAVTSALPPPTVTTGSATWLTSATTTLTGTVNPNGYATTARFEYGPTTAYGTVKTVTLSSDNGTAPLPVSVDLGSLPAGTTYHYRLTATNSNDTSTGTDRVFVTNRTVGDYTYATCDHAATITEYTGAGGAVVIPVTVNGLTVTGIGYQAFYNKTALTDVVLPNDVAWIGDWAFDGCSGLTAFSIPASVTSIGRMAFFRCTALSNVIIPGGTTSIGLGPFSGCTALTGITVSADNPNFSSVEGVLFDKARTRLIQYPCGKTGAYIVASSVTNIEDFAFYGAKGLSSVAIPSGVITIGSAAFRNCTGPSTINVDLANPNYSSLDGVLFDKTRTILLQYPCGKTGAYTIPDGVTSIADYAFYPCAGLTSVVIPKSVASIGSWSFRACSGLTSVTIPNGVTSIGSSSFSICTLLSGALFTGNAPTMGSNVFANTAPGFTVYYFPDTTGFTSPTWLGYPAIAIARSFPMVTTGAVTGVTAVSVVLRGTVNPNGFTTTARFEYGLTTAYGSVVDVALSPPDGTTNQEVGATVAGLQSGKTYHYRLTAVNAAGFTAGEDKTFVTEAVWGDFRYTVSDDLVTITGYTGAGGAVVIPATITGLPVVAIGDFAFAGRTNVTGCTIPAGVAKIGFGVFGWCSGLTAIAVDAANPAYRSVDGVLFDKAKTSLLQYPAGRTESYYRIPAGVMNIAEGAFYGCGRLTQVSIPASVTSIGPWAFGDCWGLIFFDVRYANPAYSSLGGVLFNKSQTELIQYPAGRLYESHYPVPSGVTDVGEGAFYGCGGLTTLTIPASVGFIGEGAFYGCGRLTNVFFGGNAPIVEDVVPFQGSAAGFTVYYFTDTSGFTSPTWLGYRAIAIARLLPTATTGYFNVVPQPWNYVALRGNVNPNTVPTTAWFEYGLTTAYGDSASVTLSPNNGSTAQSVSANVNGYLLRPGKTYHYRLVATNAAGSTQGEDRTFVAPFPPVIETQPVGMTVGIGSDVGFSVVADGDAPLFYQWYKGSTELVDGGNLSGAKSSALALSNVQPGDAGDYTVKVSNYAGDRTSGVARLVVLPPGPPTATTEGVDAVTWNSATLHGTVNPNGYASVARFEYGLTTAYGDTAGVVLAPDNGAAAQQVTAHLTGLQAGTTYHFRLTASNGSGTTEGEDRTFTTSGVWGDFVYTVAAGEVSVIGYLGAGGVVGIPDMIEELPVTSVGEFAFGDHPGLASVTIPQGVAVIGHGAFYGCHGLTNVVIPASVTSIGEGAFADCVGLGSLTIAAGVTAIGDYAFAGCFGLTSLTLPASLTSIGDWAFEYCAGLTQVIFPGGVTGIGEAAFYGCWGLTRAIFMGTAPGMGPGAFDNTAAGFAVYYQSGASGFTTPTWEGYPALPIEAPAFISVALPGGTVGVPYSSTLTASGAPPPSFAVTSGALPDGLILSADGVVSGTPAVAGTFNCVIGASNGVTTDATLAFSVMIEPAITHTHDHFAFRTTIPAETYVLTGNSAGATKEPGEPAHAGNAGGASVWWTWTAPADGATTVSTAGSGFDTLLGVYTGGAVDALSLVAANDDDSAGGTTSKVSFTAVAGTVYQIAVDGKNGATGDIRLTITPPIVARELGAPRVEPNGGTWRLTPPWPVPGRRYRLQYSDTMTRGTWLDVPPERVVAAGEPFVLEMARDSAVARRFFRMSLDPGRAPEGFVWVPAGTFWMGSPADEPGRESNETRHEVTLTRGLWLESTEVTWAEWSAVRARAAEKGYTDLGAGRNGLSGDGGGLHPVTEVSWWDAVKWCNLRSEVEGRTPVYYKVAGFGAANVLRTGSGAIYADWNADGYRLPSEAEWERACRAGTTTAFWSGAITQTGSTPLDPALDLAGWYGGNAGSNTHAIGGKAANAWGLSDTHGNVWEWCWDFYGSYGTASQTDPRGPGSGNWRVLRGGSVTNVAKGCRAAFRALVLPGERVNTHGFRVAVSAGP